VNPTGPARAEAAAATPAAALFAQGLALHQRGELAQAGALYRQVLQVEPRHVDALHLLGVVAAQTGNPLAAAELMGRALELDPHHPAILANRGNALEDLQRLEEALQAFRRAYALAPDQDYLLGMVLRVQQHLSLWEGWDEGLQALRQALLSGRKAAMPFEVLSMVDDPVLHRRCSQIYTQDRFPPDDTLGPLAPRRSRGSSDRIHVAYFSSDFFSHATLHLMLEMLERHDRGRFELTAFSFGPARADDWRARAAGAVDRFIDVHERTDREIATMARQLRVDIGIDLKGHTNNARAGIFSFRTAPLQVNFLGYPGTPGSPLIDYHIADHVIIPDASLENYDEKIVRLPGCYQPNLARREPSDRRTDRAGHGLPAQGFVFASFNANYKINPEVYDRWMRVLQRVPGSVLWLLVANGSAEHHLRESARQRGVPSSRLVFARSLPVEQHLERMRLADLMLDCHPYGAGTTASDALRMGVPVLTRPGLSFASRLAASLLRTVGLDELVVATPQDYEDQAVALALAPAALAPIRRRLVEGIARAGVFDPALYARRIEAAYIAMFERQQRGLAPAHLDVVEWVQGGAPVAGARAYGSIEADPAQGIEALLAAASQSYRDGHADRAAGLLEIATRRAPGHAAERSRLGAALLALGRHDHAIASLRAAVALAPGNAEFHNNLGVALHARDRALEARDCFDRALALHPEYAAARRNRQAVVHALHGFG
jgi:predicted O-linked N-acetylglucosamine transferase (SPINDLY family)